jgi:hypothetical protein
MDVSTEDNGPAEDNPGTRTETTDYSRSDTMRTKISYLTPLFGAAAAAAAIIAAPIAAASTVPGAAQQSCDPSGSGTVCQSPGNVEINDSPPPVSYDPYGGDAFLLGGYGGGFHGGGFHGGGGGHR